MTFRAKVLTCAARMGRAKPGLSDRARNRRSCKRVRAWRHARQIDPESEAYAKLLTAALDAEEQTESEEKQKRS